MKNKKLALLLSKLPEYKRAAFIEEMKVVSADEYENIIAEYGIVLSDEEKEYLTSEVNLALGDEELESTAGGCGFLGPIPQCDEFSCSC